MSCSYKEKVLSYIRGIIEDEKEALIIEKHIDSCAECQALIEGYTQKSQEIVDIPEKKFNGNDNKLKERVVSYEKGTRRIIVFTIVGLFLGWFSYLYYKDQFIVTKIILAIPYKVNEMIHNILHSHRGALEYYYRSNFNEFFPQSAMATFLAERITPALIGSAIYGSLAYFTGSKVVFTLRKYMKFAALWCLVIFIWIGGTFLLNSYTVLNNNELKNISGYGLKSETGSSFYYNDYRESIFNMIDEAFHEDSYPKLLESIKRDEINEHYIEFYFGKIHSGYMVAVINPIDRYIVTDNGKIYEISESFAKLVLEHMNENNIISNKELKESQIFLDIEKELSRK